MAAMLFDFKKRKLNYYIKISGSKHVCLIYGLYAKIFGSLDNRINVFAAKRR